MTSAATTDNLTGLIRDVEELVDRYDDEHELTAKVAEKLQERLAAGLDLPESVTRPSTVRYVMYPLYVDPAGRFSIASAVWNVGQGTPVHGHETWGVVGIYSGVEHELNYTKPADGQPTSLVSEHDWSPGSVTVCCTTDDDVHQVFCGSDVPCVGIHVYGADIGTLQRRSYDPETGKTTWFVSTWTEPTD
jgi:predicted metal-dependent enzyme (double-stranded beta helix superfamily)